VLGEIDCQRLVLSFDCNNQVGQTFACLFFDIFVGMFFDDAAEQIDCLLDVGIIEFLELFNENVQHGDSNFCFLCFISVDILLFLFLFLIFLF
jgi:hypothetical protein